MLRRQFAKPLREGVGDRRESLDALKADDLEAGPELALCDFGDELLERVLARMEFVGECEERGAELQSWLEGCHWALVPRSGSAQRLLRARDPIEPGNVGWIEAYGQVDLMGVALQLRRFDMQVARIEYVPPFVDEFAERRHRELLVVDLERELRRRHFPPIDLEPGNLDRRQRQRPIPWQPDVECQARRGPAVANLGNQSLLEAVGHLAHPNHRLEYAF